MQNITNIFEQLGIYALPAVILLAEVIIFIYLAGAVCRNKKAKNENNVNYKNSDILSSAISAAEDRGYMVVRYGDFMPLAVNKSFERLTGVSFEEICKDFEALGRTADNTQYNNFKIKYTQWNGEEPLKEVYYNKITHKWLKAVIYKTSDPNLTLYAFDDITDSISKRDELYKKLEKAEKTSRSKTEFLSKMSHDIRTPMNGILGMLSLMKINLKEDKHLLQYIDKAESLSQFLLNLINDILDISRIEAGKIELEAEPFDLNMLAEKFNSMFRKTIEEKGVQFNIELEDIQNPVVIGDELRVSQVLINFISNAIKFTEKGEIQIKIRQISLAEGIGGYMFRVRDTGKGIDPKFINDLFRPFEQESAKIARKYGGSGLGLAIADQMVHLMKGEIVVDSMPGKGTDFTVYINLPVADSVLAEDNVKTLGKPHEDKEFSWEGITILMAEDNEINAEIAVEMLEMEGANVEVAPDGEEVINMFKERGRGYYDVILMDVQMPVRNGWEAAKLIRQMKSLDGDIIPIFALSADAFVEDRRHSIEVGMNGHLTKPIDYGKLKEAVGEAMKG